MLYELAPISALQLIAPVLYGRLQVPLDRDYGSNIPAYLSNPATCCVDYRAYRGVKRRLAPVLLDKDS
jgi:hypothetical protein